MSKVRRIVLLTVLSAFVLAGSAMAGPGHNQNGDPDGPQIAHRTAAVVGGWGGGLAVRSAIDVTGETKRLPAPLRYLLRTYLRMHGIGVR